MGRRLFNGSRHANASPNCVSYVTADRELPIDVGLFVPVSAGVRSLSLLRISILVFGWKKTVEGNANAPHSCVHQFRFRRAPRRAVRHPREMNSKNSDASGTREQGNPQVGRNYPAIPVCENIWERVRFSLIAIRVLTVHFELPSFLYPGLLQFRIRRSAH